MKSSHIKFLSLIIAYITFYPALAFAGSGKTALADSLYAKGEYRQAADAYLAIAKNDGASAELYFNLANACAQCNDYAGAMLYYSRASRLAPGDKAIQNNLDYVSSKVEDLNRAELRGKKISVAPDPDTFFSSAHRMIAENVGSNTWATWSVLCFILFLTGVAVYLFCSNVMLRKTGFFGGFSLFVLSVFFLVFAFMSAGYSDSSDSGVLMAYKTELKIEPSDDAKPASNFLCQGTVLDIVAEETGVDGKPSWYKVRLNANVEGWLKADDLEII